MKKTKSRKKEQSKISSKMYLLIGVISIAVFLLLSSLNIENQNLSGAAKKLPPADPTKLTRFDGGPTDWAGTFEPYAKCVATAIDCPEGKRLWVCSGGSGTAYIWRKAAGYPDFMRVCSEPTGETENTGYCGNSGQKCCLAAPSCKEGSTCSAGRCVTTVASIGGSRKGTPFAKDPNQGAGGTGGGSGIFGGGGTLDGTVESTPSYQCPNEQGEYVPC